MQDNGMTERHPDLREQICDMANMTVVGHRFEFGDAINDVLVDKVPARLRAQNFDW